MINLRFSLIELYIYKLKIDVKTRWLKHKYFHFNLQMFHIYISILNLIVALRHIEFTA